MAESSPATGKLSSLRLMTASELRKLTTPAARTEASTGSVGAMPSSQASSSSSSVVVISDSDSDNAALSRPVANRVASSLSSQGAVDALCKKHRVPSVYTARPAGNRRACTPPPRGAVCVYAHALEAGMRVPLHPFFSNALTHFGLAPGQLAPSGWRVLVGFFVLCHDAGVLPSVTIFGHFFSLAASKLKGWYCFRAKNAADALFTGLPKSNKGWKGKFFFLESPEPWPCPVRWGEPPSKSSDPVLTSQQNKTVEKLLGAHATAVDLRTYLSDRNLAAAFSSSLSCASPPPPQPSLRSTAGAKAVEKVKPEPDGDTPSLSVKKRKHEEEAAAKAKDDLGRSEQSTLSVKRRKHEEAPAGNAKDGLGRSKHSTHPATHVYSASASAGEPVPDTHDGESADWETARKVLGRIITPSRQLEFAAAKPSDIVASTYLAVLQAARTTSFSLNYALELEEKLATRDAEAADLRRQLEESKATLAASREAAKAEVESARTAAVQQFLGSEEYTRRVAEQALAAYERGAEVMKHVALRLNPRLDAAKLVLPLD